MTTLKETLKKLAPEFGLSLTEGEDDERAKEVEQEVIDKLDRSVKFDEVDTVTFGLETDDGKIVKVYVKADQSEDFEKALSDKLGEIDDIETVLNELSKDFDIVDVEWPAEEDGAPGDEATDTGADVMNQEVYNNAKERSEMEDDLKPKLEDLSVGEKVTLDLLENTQSLESRFTTATQLMVYHAILELGIPEIVLTRSPYRASIVRAIRNKAFDLNKSPALKSALKMFISRTDDFEQKAKENEEGEAKEKGGKVKESQVEAPRLAQKILVNEEACEWKFELNGDNFTVACNSLSVTLTPEDTEKMIKGVTNRDAVVVRDSEDQAKKFVFSPRGSSLVVKRVGSAEGFTMASKDVDAMLDSVNPDKPTDEEESSK